MSPILVRPVREQLEHDRLIRLLQAQRAKRKTEIGINPGAEQNVAVGTGARREFPDLVIVSTDKGRKVQAVVEVETGESVNHLEAMAQWAHYGRLRVPFHLYVPASSADVARRLCADQGISVDEFWAYHHVGDQVRFTLVQKAESPAARASRTQAAASKGKPPAAAAKPVRQTAAKTARPAARSGRTGASKTAKRAPARSAKAPVRKRAAVTKAPSRKVTPKKKTARRK